MKPTAPRWLGRAALGGLVGLVAALCGPPAQGAEPSVQAAPPPRAAASSATVLRLGSPLTAGERRQLLSLSPVPPPPPDPSNRWADDPRAVALGERLFFDAGLSGGSGLGGDSGLAGLAARSCASCHDPTKGWSDGKPVADDGIRFPRNVPTLWNSAHSRWFTWDGRADSAWAQALGPLENPREMAGDRVSIVRHLAADPGLRGAYEELFGSLPPLDARGSDGRARFPHAARPVADDPTDPLHRAWAAMSPDDRQLVDDAFVRVGKALAAYQRTLVTPEAPFDRWVEALREVESGGEPPTEPVLSASAVRGARLFVGRGQCTLCHSGPTFSDGEFHDVGIALGAGGRIDPGRYGGIVALLQSPFSRVGRFSDAPESLAPVRFLQLRTEQMGQFKTPTLRQLADTAPYMHDGRFATLTEVVTFYSTREGAAVLGHPTTLLQPLDLDGGEIADLVAFLESLSAKVQPATRSTL
ncbi:MAG: cytochrome c peroxidase [Acidobacteriota bacterium]